MTDRYKKLTSKQFREVVTPYLEAFPDWQRFGDMGIFREEFPIRQQITFENLSSGMYRPVHAVRALPLRLSRMLFQHLGARCRQLTYRQHKGQWREMLACIRDQFRPSVIAPLNIEEVILLCESESLGRANDLSMLAILYAWRGDDDKALECCLRIRGAPTPTIAVREDLEQTIRTFGEQLILAITKSEARRFLWLKAEQAKGE